MQSKERFPNVMFGMSPRPQGAALVIMLTLSFLIFITFATQPTQGQTYKVIYNFTGGADGLYPGNLVMDQAGNLYGTSAAAPYGIVFRLTPMRSGWAFSTVYAFNGNNDGIGPDGLAVAPGGDLYGTTGAGGSGASGGTVFDLKPSVISCITGQCRWSETIIYNFSDISHGAVPVDGVLIDPDGNLFGTASSGGKAGCDQFGIGCGTVYKLTHAAQGWAETTLHTFQGEPDGDQPSFAVVRDRQGNLYGTTFFGGDYGYGSLFELSPSGSQWTETILHSFPNYGSATSRLILDPSGNLFGTTAQAVFMLSPWDDGWSYSELYSDDEHVALSGLAMDADGNLYGTNSAGGTNDCGYVYKLTKSESSWIYSDMHDLGGGWDGCRPSTLVFGREGKLYGTAHEGRYRCPGSGGQEGCGVVFEIDP